MRVYTTTPYLVDNSGLAYVKIIIGADDSTAGTVVGRAWRLVFNKFTSTGFYNPLIWVSVFEGGGAGLNYASFDNNFPSPPLTDWDPNPATGSIPSGNDRIGITIAMSPSNSFVTLDWDFTIQVEYSPGLWTPLFPLLVEPVTVLGTDTSSPDATTGTDLIGSGLVVVTAGADESNLCFWQDLVGVTEDCPVVPEEGGFHVQSLFALNTDPDLFVDEGGAIVVLDCRTATQLHGVPIRVVIGPAMSIDLGDSDQFSVCSEGAGVINVIGAEVNTETSSPRSFSIEPLQ